MNANKYVFSQVTSFLPQRFFNRLVSKYDDRTKNWKFSHWNQMLALILGQLIGCASLRELVGTINANSKMSYHLGLGKNLIDLKTFSIANKVRDVKIFEQYAFYMIDIAQKKLSFKDFCLHGKFYAIDSTTIDLCMSVFEWANFRSTKSGIKIHTQIDLTTKIPTFYRITNANVHDTKGMDFIEIEPLACYVFDRGYFDLDRLYKINLTNAFFIIREKGLPDYEIISGEDLLENDDNILRDQTIRFIGNRNRDNYPSELRRIVYYALELKRTFVYYTNNFYLKANEIALLYKNRWQVELFFKWIKQYLKVKTFWGTSENAVRIQIHIAIITYCLINIIKNDLKL
ncbi:IS4 family transposase, partial [Capnocytophaga granulosa]